jgi:hypothetical protein
METGSEHALGRHRLFISSGRSRIAMKKLIFLIALTAALAAAASSAGTSTETLVLITDV